MGGAVVALEDHARGAQWTSIAVRLADEGVPVRAIVRALKQTPDDVRDCLATAQAKGEILSIPRDDWPPGTRSNDRRPDVVPLDIESDEMLLSIARTFKITPAMSRVFAALLRRPEMTKATLHLAVQREGSDVTDPKIVDVMICKLRKVMPKYDIEIKTIWGRGYFIPPESKVLAFKQMKMQYVAPYLPPLSKGSPTLLDAVEGMEEGAEKQAA